MRTIKLSITLNVLSQILIFGSFVNVILSDSISFIAIFLSLVLIFIAFLLLFFNRSEFKKIKGVMVSSKVTIIHKFFSTTVIISFLQYMLYYFIHEKLILRNEFINIDLMLITMMAICIGVVLFVFKFKQIKFDNKKLYISNYITCKEVFLSDVRWLKRGEFPLSFKIKYIKDNKLYIDYFITGTGTYLLDSKVTNLKETIENAI
jgi:hypothetical protein